MADDEPVDMSTDSKKRKIDDKVKSELTFGGFSIKRVLKEDLRAKLVCLECTRGDDTAVVILEKDHFQSSHLPRILSQDTSLTETLKNDIYSTYEAKPPVEFAGIKSTVICPATQRHIDKYSDHDSWIVRETTELYKSVTLPCIEQSNFSVQWVYNILAKKSEAERIVFEDPDPDVGFILLPDMKWSEKSVDSLYLVAIVHKHGIKSLRDLSSSHIPLLQNILDKGTTAIQDRYSVPKSQLRIYLHYQPSYYHLHVHFTHVKYDAPGSDVMRAHLLEDVIENMQASDLYYRDKTLIFTVRENQDLYHCFKKAGHFE